MDKFRAPSNVKEKIMNMEMMGVRMTELDMMLRQSEANHNALCGRKAELQMMYDAMKKKGRSPDARCCHGTS